MENKPSVLTQRYELGRQLGQGAFAKVYYGRSLQTSQGVAIKVIDKEKILKVGLMEQIKREISVMRIVKHPNIVRLYEVMATKSKIYFVMEYAKGGELFNKVAKGKLKEDVARKFFIQLMNAVDFCHSRNVYHRDIKPENLLLDENDNLKVSDFGLSALAESKRQDGLLHTTCGTPAYVAPEVIGQKGYDGAKADIWSCGVVLFVLLAGYLPFHDSNLMEMYRKIGSADFKCPSWFPPEVRRLLRKILDPNPSARISIAKIKESSWFRKGLISDKQIMRKMENRDKGVMQSSSSSSSESSGIPNESKAEHEKPPYLNAFAHPHPSAPRRRVPITIPNRSSPIAPAPFCSSPEGPDLRPIDPPGKLRPAMSAGGKPPQPPPPQSPSPSSLFTLRGSLLTLALLTLASFTVVSLNSLRSPAAAAAAPGTLTPSFSILKMSREAAGDGDGDGGGGGGEELSDIYHLPEVFRLNYAAMERDFGVFIYPDGDPNTFYQTPRKLTGKYASEGYFFQNIREGRFRTDDPDRAHLFFIPISCHKMRGKGTSYENMTVIVQNYVDSLIAKYPYWNRTLGADHFFVTCHDVGVRATEGVPLLVKNSIRVVCSPSYDVGFIPHKDVALPQVLQPFALPAGGNDVENRTRLGFWAGHRNSKIRVILARVWENDTELDISNNRISRATGHLVYQKRFYRTKFCICPGGSQVNSARIADAIHYGCVPVILSNYYDLPFNDILDWRKFSVIVKESEVYNLKQILKNISDAEFLQLHENLVKVQKHFQWNSPPIKYDAFHMIMYELWLRHHVIKY